MTVIVKAKYFVFRDFVIRQRNLDVEKTLCWSVGSHLDEQATRFRYCLVSMGIRWQISVLKVEFWINYECL